MKLWLLTQSVCKGYDTYDSAVVAAEDVEAARGTHPVGEWDHSYGSWPESPNDVRAEYLGKAKDGTKAGVICASFNAG